MFQNFGSWKFRRIKVGQIQNFIPVGSEARDLIIGQRFALKDPAALSPEALFALGILHPVHVVPSGKKFQVIANHRTAHLLSRLGAQTEIPAFQWSGLPASRPAPVSSAFLSALAFGLDLKYSQNGLLVLFDALSKQDRIRISPQLRSRVGLERLTGLSRKVKIQKPKIVPAKLEQVGLPFEAEDE